MAHLATGLGRYHLGAADSCCRTRYIAGVRLPSGTVAYSEHAQLAVCLRQQRQQSVAYATRPRHADKGSSSRDMVVLTEPVSRLDVDRELWEVLDLCTNEELETLYNILYGPSPLSPVVKSLVKENQPAMVEARGRTSIMHKVESRFRFLAADSSGTLSGQWPSYRQTLLAAKDRLGVPCSSQLSTPDLETELFVHILHHCVEYVVAEGDPDPREAAAVAYAYEGDGMTSMSAAGRVRRTNWTERVTAPFRFGGRELLPSLAKLGSAVAVGAWGRRMAELLAGQLGAQQLRFQAAALAATSSSAAAGGLSAWQRQAALRAAQHGLSTAMARYSALRGAMGALSPLLWGWAALDLAKAALGTDHARVLRAVFVLAQVRLLATAGWDAPAEGALTVAGDWEEEDVPGVC